MEISLIEIMQGRIHETPQEMFVVLVSGKCFKTLFGHLCFPTKHQMCTDMLIKRHCYNHSFIFFNGTYIYATVYICYLYGTSFYFHVHTLMFCKEVLTIWIKISNIGLMKLIIC